MSFNYNKHLNTFNMVAGLEFKLVRQKHEIVLFFAAYCFTYEFLESLEVWLNWNQWLKSLLLYVSSNAVEFL